MGSPSSCHGRKRQRREIGDPCCYCAERKHLYLALDDERGGNPGYAIHKLDADNMEMEDHLPEPVLRVAAPGRGPMAFTAVATSIFVATNPDCDRYDDRAPPTLVYDTRTGALALGPHLPGSFLEGGPMAVGEKLYGIARSVRRGGKDDDGEELIPSSYVALQVMSWAPAALCLDPWDPAPMAWSWRQGQSTPPPMSTTLGGAVITSYALHPDGHTVFVSTRHDTHSLDTSDGDGVWKELGDWVLPFQGQAYFDAELDAWVGLHRKEDGYVCCCPVVSWGTVTTRPPECTILKEKLFRSKDEKHPNVQHMKATLTYMGDSRYCLAENILDHDNVFQGTLRVTLFGLEYGRKGELQTKVHRTTRSYPLSKIGTSFSHEAFWL